MKTKFSASVKMFAVALSVFTMSCEKVETTPKSLNEAKVTANSAQLAALTATDFQTIADKLAARMNGNCVGYSFIVSYQGQYKTSRSGGFSRTVKDLPITPFTMYDKYSIASVSKTITATALIKLLNNLPGGAFGSLDTPIWTYLPSHWQMGMNIKTITFRQLLTHTSGFRYSADGKTDGDDYQTLKNLVAAGVQNSNKVYQYNNRNFALMRLMIPKLAKYNVITIPNGLPAFTLSILENTQAGQFASDYKDYCRQVIFNQLGTTATQTIDCVNTDVNPGLCYTFPYNFANGTNTGGDLTMSAGAQGWVLNTVQINDFFTTLQYTEHLLPLTLSTYMKNQLLGYDRSGTLTDGTTFYWKNGVYELGAIPPGASFGVNGSYRSLIIGFSDDIQITMMANSPINLQNAANGAHQDWHP